MARCRRFCGCTTSPIRRIWRTRLAALPGLPRSRISRSCSRSTETFRRAGRGWKLSLTSGSLWAAASICLRNVLDRFLGSLYVDQQLLPIGGAHQPEKGDAGRMATQSGEPAADLKPKQGGTGGKFDAIRAMLETGALRLHVLPGGAPAGAALSGAESGGPVCVVRRRRRCGFLRCRRCRFPASEIQDAADREGRQPNAAVNFMGLERGRRERCRILIRNFCWSAFAPRTMDRASSSTYSTSGSSALFYRAWQKYRFYIAYERTGRDGRCDQREAAGPDRAGDQRADAPHGN